MLRALIVAAALAGALLHAPASQAEDGICWTQAAERYHVNPWLLYAIGKTESSLNPNAFHRNRDGSYDIGIMQINSSWLPTLAPYGINSRNLLDPCINIMVGAWVLASNIQKMGNSWDAVGAYNSPTKANQVKYAARVLRNFQKDFPQLAVNLRKSSGMTAPAVRRGILDSDQPDKILAQTDRN